MRQFIYGLVAAAAVVSATAAPASACGGYYTTCGGGYYAGGYVYGGGYNGYGYGGGSGYGAGYGYDELPRPTAQYYYANQGPVYSGPASYAPYPSYQQDYGYNGGPYANATTHYTPGGYGQGPAIYSYDRSYRMWRPRPAFHGGGYRPRYYTGLRMPHRQHWHHGPVVRRYY